jgi:hypothetical protein
VILYLYAIADGLDRVDDVPGATGEPLTVLTVEGVQVVTGEVVATPQIDESSLGRQDAIVRELHARAAALLPMRFGAAFASRSQMQSALALRLPALQQRLAIVRGAEQMTLRILGGAGGTGAAGARTAGAAGAAGAGVNYLRERAARAVPQDVTTLLDAVRRLQRATRVEPGKTPGIVATVYQLINRGASAEYYLLVNVAAKRLPGLSVRVSGPAPCYAFT